ncbi:hypothetical protein [Jiangella asiatica]|nr:hypothetical protein [Jiangella asiatica]
MALRRALDNRHPGAMPVNWTRARDGTSRWNALRALRVLDWSFARG